MFTSTVVLGFGASRMPVGNAFDHVLLGAADLDKGIEWFEKRTGIRAAVGGVHPGRGTRNALVSLGGAHYLEIIAPDPAQAAVDRALQLRNLSEPRLINFAVRTTNIEKTAAALREAGVSAMGPIDGSRRTDSGAMLRWRTLTVESKFQAGAINPIPFFIEWAKDTAHPAKNAPAGCVIEDLRFEHLRPDELKAALEASGLEARVAKAEQVRIIASVQTPKGRVELT